MINFFIIFLALLTFGCQALPQIAQDVDDFITADAVKIVISKEAVQQKQKNINVIVEIQNEKKD